MMESEMSSQDTEQRKCKYCGEPSFLIFGRWACARHHRYAQMRKAALRDGKAVPTYEQLDTMPGSNLVCPTCDVQMNWFMKDGGPTVAALQHYRDGTLAIVCLACNARHGQMPGDTYRDLPKDHKRCPQCEEIKPRSEFYTKQWGDRKPKITSNCKQCCKAKKAAEHKKYKDRINEGQRRRYHAKKMAATTVGA